MLGAGISWEWVKKRIKASHRPALTCMWAQPELLCARAVEAVRYLGVAADVGVGC